MWLGPAPRQTQDIKNAKREPWNGFPLKNDIQLFSEIEVGQYGAVPGDVLVLQVVEEPLALTNQVKQASLGGEILLILLQVRREVIDAVRKEGNL